MAQSGQRNMSQLHLKPSAPLSFEGNVSENWKKWYKKFEIYMQATESDKKGDVTKVAILLHAIGEEAQEKYETFDFSEEQQTDYQNVVTAFEKYCVPRKNETVSRHQFFQRNQRPDETFNEFLT